ncbi:MAG TPA: DUF4185 domain-containing protein [Chloroflexi bacterium]|nr:DUF4185 domain-containing protein [Chloroflexota bacterium]
MHRVPPLYIKESIMKRSFLPVLLLCGLFLIACGEEPPSPLEEAGDCPECVIQRAYLAGEYVSIPYMGDLWVATWADDDNLYLSFGDATGMDSCLPTLLMDEPDEFDADYIEESPGCYTVRDTDNEYCEVFGCERCLPLCQYTPAGLIRLSGPVPDFAPCEGPDQCVISRHIPYGDLTVFENSDKPSSLIFIAGRMYMPMHYPPGEPTSGYIAYSDDYGRTWEQVPDSPWGADSPFRVLMFINMGRAYEADQDGYLYGLGVGDEVADPPRSQAVYLTRVPLAAGSPPAPADDPVLDYAAYEYFAGLDEIGNPIWSPDPDDAAPLDGLATMAQGSAMYHPDLRRYLFLSGLVGTAPGAEAGLEGVTDEIPVGVLYEAPFPWGPWRPAALFPGGFIASLLPKGAGPNDLYFTASGGGGVTYNLNVGHLRLEIRPPETPALFDLLATRKVEQIIGDIDFETLEPTRQQTESRFNLAHTDLGAPFEHRGDLWFLFGDSDPEAPGWDEYHDDAIAYTDARSPESFRLTFLTDPESGRGYLNPRITCPDRGGEECGDLGALNVPVAGLSDGETMFVWFTTDAAGRSLLARSDDDGRTFQKVYDFGDTHFIDLAVARVDDPVPGLSPDDAPWVLIFGSGDHEHNHVYLAAAPLQSLREGDRSAVRFLSAIEYVAPDEVRPGWSPREADSVPIFTIEHGQGVGLMSEVPHEWGFGEPLVLYSERLGLWLATYNAARRTIRLRTAENPWGPWSESIVLFDPAQDYGRGPAYGRYIGDDRTERLGGQGELYGPYIIDRFTRVEDGEVRLYWLLSPWQPYTVLLMESRLRRRVAASR